MFIRSMGARVCFFFFSSRRRHTRWPRDWSSDVCSSDLSCEADVMSASRVADVSPRAEVARAGHEAPRVLIVDDEQSMREWMRILFQRDGFDVLLAENGVAARDLLGREYVDVVLTDIRMPRMDGLELLKCAREIAPDAIVMM